MKPMSANFRLLNLAGANDETHSISLYGDVIISTQSIGEFNLANYQSNNVSFHCNEKFGVMDGKWKEFN
ncbi:hypothetical protein SNEBB_000711 [Seison nebaliae]|nr:hypothetical protein SNEBB_000711 [Seison nebaliae]